MIKRKVLKNLLKKVVKSAFFANLISFLVYWYARLVGASTRWNIYGKEKCLKIWDKEETIILISWHGRALMLPYFWNRYKPINALVSLHQDGRLIARLLQKFGIGIIGGSSNENARGAAMGLMHSLQKNESIAIIPDGPVGPNMKMSMSPLYFAQKSGKPIFGMTYSVKKSKIITKSWDDMMIPFPFSKGVCKLTEPFYIPKDATVEDMEKYRQQIEDSLNKMTYEADTEVGIPPVLPNHKVKRKKHPKQSAGASK